MSWFHDWTVGDTGIRPLGVSRAHLAGVVEDPPKKLTYLTRIPLGENARCAHIRCCLTSWHMPGFGFWPRPVVAGLAFRALAALALVGTIGVACLAFALGRA